MLCCFFVLYLLLTFIYTPSVAYVADSHRASSQAAYRYAIIVDAGSSGSRLFVYCIPLIESTTRSLPSVTLCTDDKGEPLTKKVNPGLSSFSSDPSSSGVYISSLVSIAAKHIPKKYHSVTPIYILATAGMRLLSESQQSDIWNAVREAIKNDFDFKFEESWMQTVSGYYEALYGWITVNYLLDNFVDPPKPSVGMLDMGGASMQIAYEVPSEAQVLEDHIMRFTIGGKNTYNVYVMTFLGYGTHAAKSSLCLDVKVVSCGHSTRGLNSVSAIFVGKALVILVLSRLIFITLTCQVSSAYQLLFKPVLESDLLRSHVFSEH
uniref:Apyrase n=1 Tax=Mesocestoides corti TaxID=53468 RepID=A0A5K3EUY5_MESCO